MKQFSKNDGSYLINSSLTWMFLNFAFNLFGLLISKVHNEADYIYPDNILREFVIPTLLQSLLFGVFFGLALFLLKDKWRKWSQFTYPALQLVIFHVFFFINLKISHGLHFVSTFKSVGVKYMGYFGNSLVDLVPINGTFTQQIFAPDKTGLFYLIWVLLNILYMVFLSWLAVIAAGYFFNAKLVVPELTVNSEEIEAK